MIDYTTVLLSVLATISVLFIFVYYIYRKKFSWYYDTYDKIVQDLVTGSYIIINPVNKNISLTLDKNIATKMIRDTKNSLFLESDPNVCVSWNGEKFVIGCVNNK